MKLVIQRVKNASVEVKNKIVGKIDKGLLIFIGIGSEDTKEIADFLVQKLIKLRIFEDENEKMNINIKDINGELLIVSQFTLYADCASGNRPSFTNAAKKDLANNLYEYFIKKCEQENIKVEHGIFGADMQVELLNDGPVTILLEKE